MVRNGGRYAALAFLFALAVSGIAWGQAGPPFQTDDPTPVEYGHYEAYIFGTVDGTPAEVDTTGPAFEFNWGAVPNVQLHVILPWGGFFPSNNPEYAPDGQQPSAFGLTDMEFGVKYGFVRQKGHRPQIGTFPMLEIPTGNSEKGLGVGHMWYRLPIWVAKDLGAWTVDGGAGYTIVPQERNFAYGGFLVRHPINKRLELAAEIFSHAREAEGQASTMIDAGGYYNFKSPGLQFLFAYGHSVAGQTENYAYIGLYKTWGKDKGPPQTQ